MLLDAVRVLTKPAAGQWPVTTDEALTHLRLSADTDAEELAYVEQLVATATGMAEDYTGRAIAVQEIEATFTRDASSYSGLVASSVADVTSALARLPRPAHIVATDAMTSTGAPVAAYTAVRRGERLAVSVLEDLDELAVWFLAGYGRLTADANPALQASYTCDAPAAVKQAVLMTVADLYENRGSYVVGTITAALPVTAESLLFAFKLFDA